MVLSFSTNPYNNYHVEIIAMSGQVVVVSLHRIGA